MLAKPESSKQRSKENNLIHITNSMASHRCTYIKAIHGFQAVDTAAQDRLASTALRTVGPNNKKSAKN